ncbi:surface-adhesin E family protein [Variovorax sp. HJSM1_2]|uniref:surface-adhesin E family protein n=1 Tax=Variovorax sp. HJSM1_2 TaxID=3366263 RepID=UPI003BF4FEF3
MAGPLHADPLWLTLTGDATRADADSVQVLADSVNLNGTTGTLQLRVSRAGERSAYDDLPYRSYIGWIRVDCSQREGHFLQLQYYAEALWTGAVRLVNFTESNMPRLLFKDMDPNPTTRLIRAACSVEKVKTQ